MRITLQRDMMYYDSGYASAPIKAPKRLNIANVDKLVGMTTGPISNGWVCNKATEYPQTYDMLFNFIPGGSPMDIRILKDGNFSSDGEQAYIVEVRQLIQSPKNNSYTHSKPSAYGVTNKLLGQPKLFLAWLHSKLIEKKLETEALIWNAKPWYEKLILNIKDFLPKNPIPKIEPKHYKKITAKKAAP